jgi:hypothetical protein
MEDVGIDGKTILKWMLKNSVGRAETELIWLWTGISSRLFFHAVVNLALIYNTANIQRT